MLDLYQDEDEDAEANCHGHHGGGAVGLVAIRRGTGRRKRHSAVRHRFKPVRAVLKHDGVRCGGEIYIYI